MLRRLPWVLLAITACDGSLKTRREPPPPPPPCGDGTVGPGEQCDGANLAGQSCRGLGFDLGTLGCGPTCQFDTSGCVKLCGNGRIDPGEDCDGTVGPLRCASWGYKRCTATCTLDSSHCVSTPMTAGVGAAVDPGGPGALAHLTPVATSADLVMASSAFSRLESYRYAAGRGFQAPRFLSLGGTPAQPLAGDLDGDGNADLAAINGDGTVDRYRYLPANDRFLLENLSRLPDGGRACAGAWLGPGTATDAGIPLIAVGCPDGGSAPWAGVQIFAPGPFPLPPRLLPPSDLFSAALVDVNRDGLLDVLTASGSGRLTSQLAPAWAAGPSWSLPWIPTALAAGDLGGDGGIALAAFDGTAVQILESTDGGFTSRGSSPGTPVGLAVIDIDQDGRPDVVWLDAAGLHLRRNLGAFVFAASDYPTGPGTPLSLSIADLDGDGDLDLVAVVATGGNGIFAYVFLNGVQ